MQGDGGLKGMSPGWKSKAAMWACTPSQNLEIYLVKNEEGVKEEGGGGEML